MVNMENATKAAVLIMLGTFVTKLLGFLKELVLAFAYGTSNITDAYIIATTIPTLLFPSFVAALAITIIPVFIKIRDNYGKKESLIFINNVKNISLIICVPLALLGVFFSDYIVGILAMGFDEETFKLADSLFKITFPMIIFVTLIQINNGFLNSNNNYFVPSIIGIPNNIIIIISIIFHNIFGVYGIAIATLFGGVSQFLVQHPFAKKYGYMYNFSVNFKDANIKKLGLLMLPVLLSVGIQQINLIVDRMLASGLVEGSISALNFANKLNGFVFGVFSLSIATVIYPRLSSIKIEKEVKKFNDTILVSLNSLTIITLPIMVGAIVLRVPIISLLFERGEFDERATMMTATALLYYALGMVFLGYRDILNRVFYSIENTRTPMINGIITVIINIILNIILAKYMQHAGIALATSISIFLTTVLLFISLKKKIPSFKFQGLFYVFIKSIIASFIMGISVFFVHNILGYYLSFEYFNEFIVLMLTITFGVIVYFVLIVALKVDELNWLLESVKGIVTRNKK
jgi:putative peptidoglycan lipid II flippase